MENNIKENLKFRSIVLVKMIEMTEKKIKSLPDGWICIKRRGDRVYYYQKGKSIREKILKKDDSKLLQDLLQKNYLEKVLRSAKSEKLILDRIQKMYPEILAEDVYEHLKEERRQLVRPIVPTDEQFVQRWLEKSYTPNPIPDDVPFYQTLNGERVRSKSEMIIADRLLANGIPYKYECPLKVGKKIIHPDFSILRLSDRKIIYYEHCGRMDDPEYSEDMVNRVNDYSLAGILQGDRLFMTFETSKTPLDVRVLDKMINKIFK